MMILTPDHLHVCTLVIRLLLEIVACLDVVTVEVVLHYVVDYLGLGFCEEVFNRLVVFDHFLYEPLDEGLEGVDGDLVQLEVVPVAL